MSEVGADMDAAVDMLPHRFFEPTSSFLATCKFVAFVWGHFGSHEMQIAVRGIEGPHNFAYHFHPSSNDEDAVGKYVTRYHCIRSHVIDPRSHYEGDRGH